MHLFYLKYVRIQKYKYCTSTVWLPWCRFWLVWYQTAVWELCEDIVNTIFSDIIFKFYFYFQIELLIFLSHVNRLAFLFYLFLLKTFLPSLGILFQSTLGWCRYFVRSPTLHTEVTYLQNVYSFTCMPHFVDHIPYIFQGYMLECI